MKFYCQMYTVCFLGMMGLMIAAGEPASDADWTATMLWQKAAGVVLNWLTAFYLQRHWQLGRRMSMMERVRMRMECSRQ